MTSHSSATRPRSGRSRRSYRSTLRQEQADATRERLLDAAARAMAENPDQVSMARVAELAGVSQPTVFRYFPSKREMYAAVRADVERRLNVARLEPQSIEEVFPMLRDFFHRYENLGPERLALAATPQAVAERQARGPRRLTWVERVFARPLSRLAEPDRTAMRDVLAVLTSSGVMHAFRNHLGLPAAVAADRAEWAIRALVAAAEQKRTPGKTRGKARSER